VVIIPVLVEWRFIIEVSGELCALIIGVCQTLQWCVESWVVAILQIQCVPLTLDQDQDKSGWMM